MQAGRSSFQQTMHSQAMHSTMGTSLLGDDPRQRFLNRSRFSDRSRARSLTMKSSFGGKSWTGPRSEDEVMKTLDEGYYLQGEEFFMK